MRKRIHGTRVRIKEDFFGIYGGLKNTVFLELLDFALFDGGTNKGRPKGGEQLERESKKVKKKK